MYLWYRDPHGLHVCVIALRDKRNPQEKEMRRTCMQREENLDTGCGEIARRAFDPRAAAARLDKTGVGGVDVFLDNAVALYLRQEVLQSR